jgi:hypothetical protein
MRLRTRISKSGVFGEEERSKETEESLGTEVPGTTQGLGEGDSVKSKVCDACLGCCMRRSIAAFAAAFAALTGWMASLFCEKRFLVAASVAVNDTTLVLMPGSGMIGEMVAGPRAFFAPSRFCLRRVSIWRWLPPLYIKKHNG